MEIGDGGLVGLVASRRYDDAVKLLDSDAQFRKHVNHVDSHGNTPINYACAMNAPQQFVHRLLACGADCTIPNARGGRYSLLT